jgi:hypothetical protein
MQHFQAIGYDKMVQWIGLHVPDTTPLDFFLWGYVNDKIYAIEVRDLQAQIVEAVGTITLDMLQRTGAELDYRLDIPCVTNGAHVEVY